MAITFCQIIDARFEQGSKDELRVKLLTRINQIAIALKAINVEFGRGTLRHLDWPNEELQWRVDCVAVKPKGVTWDTVYDAINRIKAVAYTAIPDSQGLHLINSMAINTPSD